MFSNVFISAILASALVLNTGTGTPIFSDQQILGDSSAVTLRANTRLVMVDVVVTGKGPQLAG
jgi:hypothetical protein